MPSHVSDKIVLYGLEFHGFHGVFPEEAKFGARFIVDVEMWLTLPENLPEEDDMALSVDYSRVYALVKNEVTEHRYDLIEALAGMIAKRVLEEHPKVKSVTTRVHKPHAPLPGVVRDVYVEVVRHRDA